MKNALNQLASFKGFLLALVIISSLAFAGARYEIYRLNPGPKAGHIVAEKNGKWASYKLVDFIMAQDGYFPNEDDYSSGRVAVRWNEDDEEFSFFLDDQEYLKNYGGQGGSSLKTYENGLTTDRSIGSKPMPTFIDFYSSADPLITAKIVGKNFANQTYKIQLFKHGVPYVDSIVGIPYSYSLWSQSQTPFEY